MRYLITCDQLPLLRKIDKFRVWLSTGAALVATKLQTVSSALILLYRGDARKSVMPVLIVK